MIIESNPNLRNVGIAIQGQGDVSYKNIKLYSDYLSNLKNLQRVNLEILGSLRIEA